MSEVHPDLLCKQVAAVVTEYLDGQLPAADCAQLEQHLLICQACVDFIAQNKLTISGLRALSLRPPPAATRAGLLAQFRKQKGTTP